MKRKLNLLAYVIISLIITSCNANHGTGAGSAPDNSLTDGSHLVEIIADSTLIIDKEAQAGQAKFYLENKSEHTINDIAVHTSSANLTINDASDCHRALAPHETCEVSYNC
jgi:hypothetical protein